ncbi:MAG: protein phosphatase 2C domain-containing protein [Polyangiaceae bacterium]
MAAGSVAGRSHALAGRGGQDGYVVRQRGNRIVAVVTDGCGSSEGSEIGAWMGGHLVCSALERGMESGRSGDELWGEAMRDCLGALGRVANDMGGEIDEVVRRFFLFTVVGFVCDGERASLFAVGDGVLALNGEVVNIGPFPGNAPPYLGYGLLGRRAEVEVIREVAADEVESAMIATDGAGEWDRIERARIPGGDEVVGGLERFWREDRYFENPDALRRRLSRMNRRVCRTLWEERRTVQESGLLEDDTTIVVLRRRRDD